MLYSHAHIFYIHAFTFKVRCINMISNVWKTSCKNESRRNKINSKCIGKMQIKFEAAYPLYSGIFKTITEKNVDSDAEQVFQMHR